jgi:3-methylfumaryl-CoA hydratase
MSQTQPRVQTRIDPLDPDRARALQATLGDAPSIRMGDPIPPFAHHIYFWDPQPPQDLGRDGHPATGQFIPDTGLPRRMWAAGKLVFHTPLLAGIRAEKTTTVEGVTRKDGRSGPLAFVRVRHDIRQRQSLSLTEWQELVYREDRPKADAPPPPRAATDEDMAVPVSFDSTMLFRYSALTFNGHRIHYDETYARQVEGYDGLVVHGPLLAHLLMGLAQHKLGALTTFSYRATAPLMHHEPAFLCWKDGRAWVRGPDGRQCMAAEAS